MTLPSALKLSTLRLLLFSALILSTFIALNTSDWFLLWAALEINMISFIPLLYFSRTSKSWNSATEYFFPQAGGSLLILLATILSLHGPSLPQPPSFLILMAMLIKGGLAPFHYWFINIFSTQPSPLICLTLATWQKLVPAFLLSLCHIPSPNFSLFLAALSATWGMLMAANQTNIQPFIAYSSVGNLGWFLMLATLSSPASLSFFLLYSLLLSTLIYLLFSLSPNAPSLALNSPSLSLPAKMFLTLCLLSLAGFPPTTGFLLKIWAISSMTLLAPKMSWLLFLPLIMSLVAYARFIFFFIFNYSSKLLRTKTKSKNNPWLPFALTMAAHSCPAAMALFPLFP